MDATLNDVKDAKQEPLIGGNPLYAHRGFQHMISSDALQVALHQVASYNADTWGRLSKIPLGPWTDDLRKPEKPGRARFLV